MSIHLQTPLLLARRLRGGKECICSGQVLTFVKIMTRVLTPIGSTSLPAAQLTYKPDIAQEESLGPRPEPTSDQTSLNWSLTTLRDANNQYKDPFYCYRDPSRSHPRLIHEDPL